MPALSSTSPAGTGTPEIRLPAADALVLRPGGAVLVDADGLVEDLDRPALAARLEGPPLLLCHARAAARRAGRDSVLAYDVLELFAFVHPARFCVPTPAGIAAALALPLPDGPEAAALALIRSTERLLRDLTATGRKETSDPAGIAMAMGQAGWLWVPSVLAALGVAPEDLPERRRRTALQIWHRLPEWQQEAPPPPPGQHPVEPQAARARLAELLGDGAEPRTQQADYASAVSAAFAPRRTPEIPEMVLAEAGTGVGKTLGYLAPASLWAERNQAPVWIATYTRNLQHQIDGELDRLYPRADQKDGKVVVRKGRENYLCLLNLEEAQRALALQPVYGVALGVMARWAAATRDGDMTGGDFPGWLPDLIGRGRSLGLADRRGECVYSACPHYSRCYIERSIRRARKADIVIANHALVLIQVALGGLDDTALPTRYVFDEGHHLFDAADSTFAAHLSGQETAELRRWLIGADSGGRARRVRGLRRRVDDLIGDDDAALEALDAIERAARALPGEGWAGRLSGGTPAGATEAFLARVRHQVLARAGGQDGPYSLETGTESPVEGLPETAAALRGALTRLSEPLKALANGLRQRLNDEADEIDSQTRQRIDAVCRGLERRALTQLADWAAMLAGIGQPPPDAYIDWLGIERTGGEGGARELDVGYYRHWIDPTVPLAEAVLSQAHGVLVTSATLTDGSGDPDQDWQAAERRTGAAHLSRPALRAQVPSPFAYADHTRVLVVRDVRKDDLDQVAAAYRALFLAAGGGGLGLFTAISRLRAVHGRIVPALQAAGIALHAQHLDGLDAATLVDIFRAEETACLLGTDALRDGVDVPGQALRLIVFDRVPWPRPTLLHKARRDAFGGRSYDDFITRLRLKQAYGRLVRRADDKGVFVLLDPMMPSRLAGAFPDGVRVERVGLAEATATVRAFLGQE